jgi:hypothetical protein
MEAAATSVRQIKVVLETVYASLGTESAGMDRVKISMSATQIPMAVNRTVTMFVALISASAIGAMLSAMTGGRVTDVRKILMKQKVI